MAARILGLYSAYFSRTSAFSTEQCQSGHLYVKIISFTFNQCDCNDLDLRTFFFRYDIIIAANGNKVVYFMAIQII